nr:retrovirus-related Pol polyprotein from transposon TNT 1-94 [Tanacetum cinerariifolium]
MLNGTKKRTTPHFVGHPLARENVVPLVHIYPTKSQKDKKTNGVRMAPPLEWEFKIVVLGDIGTGKTSFLHRHIDGVQRSSESIVGGLRVYPMEFQSSIGREFKIVVLGDIGTGKTSFLHRHIDGVQRSSECNHPGRTKSLSDGIPIKHRKESERYDFLPMTDEEETDESSEEARQSQSPSLTQDSPLSSSKEEPNTRSLQELYEEEIKYIEKNDTWELTTLPKGQKAIGVKWVYKAKKNAKGEVEKYKARLMEKGYKQKHGIDYEEVFAPVARLETIRMIIAIAAQHKWKIHQMDVKSAFLNKLLEEEVYVEQPEGYVAKGQEGKVLGLKKALYGLKQAPHARNIRIDNMIDELKKSMTREFEMTDIGLMSYYLGIEVKQTDEGIFICQERYDKVIIKRFGMDKCNPVGNPTEHKVKPSKHDEGKAVDSTLFKSLIGSLRYLTCTRPDILCVVGLISGFMEEPTTKHLKIAKRILRYIKGTVDYGMFYSTSEDFKLVGYSDSDWAGSKDDGRYTSGSLFFLGNNAFTWYLKKQPIVTLSSCEAEYIDATSCVCHAIWLRSMLKELHMEQEDATEIYVDNIYFSNPSFRDFAAQTAREFLSWEFKIVVLDDRGTGKTSFFHRHIDGIHRSSECKLFLHQSLVTSMVDTVGEARSSGFQDAYLEDSDVRFDPLPDLLPPEVEIDIEAQT